MKTCYFTITLNNKDLLFHNTTKSSIITKHPCSNKMSVVPDFHQLSLQLRLLDKISFKLFSPACALEIRHYIMYIQ